MNPPRMSVAEFRKLGFLHEINRLVLHPAGLAIEVVVDEETGDERFGGVWDYRGEPEGIYFDQLEEDKIEKVAELQNEHMDARVKMFGGLIQTK